MTNDPIAFFFQYLGQHLEPGATPMKTISATVPIVTKKVIAERQKGGSMKGEPLRLGAGVAAYYAITSKHAWLVSQAEIAPTPHVTSLSIKDDQGNTRIRGISYLAHWLMNHAPADEPFMIGALENANPVGMLAISQPPHRVVYCNTDNKLGVVSLNLTRFRNAVRTIAESDIDWLTVQKGLRLKEKVWLAAESAIPHAEKEEEKARKQIQLMRKKQPDLMSTLTAVDIQPGSGEETMVHAYFYKGNDKGVMISA